MKNIKKIINNKYFPFLILFVILLIFFCLVKTNWGDDMWFKDYINSDFINYSLSRYNNWTSRVIIEISMVSLLKVNKFVWCAVTSLMFVLLAYSIKYLFSKSKDKKIWIIILLVLLLPLNDLNGAGWYATTLNYLYPLALGIFSLIPLKNCLDNKKEKKYMYPLYILSLLFACNQEQMAAIVFCFYLIIGIYLFLNKKLNKFIIIQLILSLMSLIFILFCPGNENRNIIETASWYPEFSSFNFIDKIYLGVVSTTMLLTSNLRIVILLFIVIIPFVIFKKNKSTIEKYISLIPITIVCLFNLLDNIVSKVLPGLFGLISETKKFTNVVPKIEINIYTIFALLISLLFIVSLLYSVYNMFDRKETKWLSLLILLAGLCSRFIIGFSPTIYASGMRTFTFLYAGIIILVYIILSDNKKKLTLSCYLILSSMVFLQFLNVLVYGQ